MRKQHQLHGAEYYYDSNEDSANICIVFRALVSVPQCRPHIAEGDPLARQQDPCPEYAGREPEQQQRRHGDYSQGCGNLAAGHVTP
ncbi:MAG: hypothetical protein RI591_07275, partial [Dehalococcoidia bacterium]|nr:hypothetical protein [Dehalococcoidia bacterium]